MNTKHTPQYKVRTISGAAGGANRKAHINIEIECFADTVEEVRQFVSTACNAHHDLVAALGNAYAIIGPLADRPGPGQMKAAAVRDSIDMALAKAKGWQS